jgi:hypothetical protein
MINLTQMHRLGGADAIAEIRRDMELQRASIICRQQLAPIGLDQQGRCATRVPVWADTEVGTDGMGYASPTPSDVTARDDVRRAERALRARAALTDAAYWVGSALALAGAAALIWWPQ